MPGIPRQAKDRRNPYIPFYSLSKAKSVKIQTRAKAARNTKQKYSFDSIKE